MVIYNKAIYYSLASDSNRGHSVVIREKRLFWVKLGLSVIWMNSAISSSRFERWRQSIYANVQSAFKFAILFKEKVEWTFCRYCFFFFFICIEDKNGIYFSVFHIQLRSNRFDKVYLFRHWAIQIVYFYDCRIFNHFQPFSIDRSQYLNIHEIYSYSVEVAFNFILPLQSYIFRIQLMVSSIPCTGSIISEKKNL